MPRQNSLVRLSWLWLVLILAACSSQSNRNPLLQSFTADPQTGDAPTVATFSWKVSDPNSDVLVCKLDADGDGKTDYTLNPCSTTGSKSHTYLNAGTFAAKLTVEDGNGGSVQQTVSVKINTPKVTAGNKSPAIAAFTSSVPSGIAPLSLTFGWSISDPNAGDTLTCKLDTDNNGSYEYTLPGCTSATTQAHVYSAAGAYTAKLLVEDDKGGSATQTLSITATTGTNPNPGGPDVRIGRVEWGQSIVKQTLKLVAGKAALLRVYVYGDRTGLSTTLQAQVYRSGVLQGNLTMVGPSSLPTSENMGDLTSTFNATVPANWVGSGLEVRLLADPNNQLAESNETNNAWTATPSLMTTGSTLYLTAVPVNYTDTGASNTLRTPTLPSNFKALFLDLYPLKDLQSQTRAAYNFTGDLRVSSDWTRLLSEIRNLAILDGSKRYYYGFVNPGYFSGIIGIGYVGAPYAVGWDYSPTNAYADDSSAWVMAHEVGHNFGRLHASCGVSSPDPSYPYTNAALGTWGFKASAGILMNPSTFKDVMSYCNPQWISDYTYTGVQDFLERTPPAAASVLAAQTQMVLFVSGKIQGSQASLDPLLRVQSAPSLPEAGPYRLRYQTATGWQEVSFGTQPVAAPHNVAFEPEDHFAFTLPDPGNIQALEVWRDQTLLLRRSLGVSSQTLPDPGLKSSEVGGKLDVSWMPAVYPYLSVAHLGAERTTIAMNQTGGEAHLSTQDLPSGGAFEIVLSDGTNSRRWLMAR